MLAFLALTLLISRLLETCESAGVSTPLRGWNSYDCYLGCVNESQVIANAEAVAKYLKKYGYQYIVVDGGWSLNNSLGIGGQQAIDEYGRPQPLPSKFPHSADGSGFKWLSDQIHAMGLKFGVWVGRGISKAALDANTPVFGTDNTVHAQDIVDYHYQCPWAQDLYALNMSVNGSQQFYDSLYSEFADWGVDLIKYDCIYAQDLVYDNIIGAYVAIEDSAHQFVLSLSPGNAPNNISLANMVSNMTNGYRITGDVWDLWDPTQPNITYQSAVILHFNVSAMYAENNLIGRNGLNGGKSYPDLDMLPLGYISSTWDGQENCEPHKQTSLTHSQQRVLFTLWSIARSPLIFGGEATKLNEDEFTLDLITNDYCLYVNANSSNNRQVVGIYTEDALPEQVIWAAHGTQNDYFVAFFYIDYGGGNATLTMSVSFEEVGIVGYSECQYVEAWSRTRGKMESGLVEVTVAVNDTALVYLENCKA